MTNFKVGQLVFLNNFRGTYPGIIVRVVNNPATHYYEGTVYIVWATNKPKPRDALTFREVTDLLDNVPLDVRTGWFK